MSTVLLDPSPGQDDASEAVGSVNLKRSDPADPGWQAVWRAPAHSTHTQRKKGESAQTAQTTQTAQTAHTCSPEAEKRNTLDDVTVSRFCHPPPHGVVIKL
eukprot:2441602-Rhodomonas_salina.3